MNYLVEMKNITKRFSGVTALENVCFNLLPGEVHILLGENGAGKSTLMKILSGVYEPTEGTIILYGKEYKKLTPRLSAENKISIIYQELSVINELSIQENIFVGKLPAKKIMNFPIVDYKYIEEKAKELLEKVGLKAPSTRLVEELRVSEKQLVEIAKALATDAKIIIMDEPTSSLTIQETENLFKFVKKLKEEGVGIIYISHKLKEIKEIGDRVTVLKDGKYVDTKDVKNLEVEDLVTMMVGREIKYKHLNSEQDCKAKNEIIFKVNNLTRKDKIVQNINFELYKGEILGFAGIIGSGRTELMEAIFGAVPIESGDMCLYGENLKIKNPYEAVKNGIAFVTENRRETGFLKNFNISQNIATAILSRKSKLGGIWGLTNTKKEREYAIEEQENLKIKCSSVDQSITELSGGNQQKVIIAKWLEANPNLIIFDEPTKGIDVGAKSEIYSIMRNLAECGKGIMMVSSELPELLGVCDRIIVFRDGVINTTFTNEEATEEKIMLAATL